MCPFLFAENFIFRESLSVLKRVNGNKFERMDNMKNYRYDVVEAGKRIREVRKKNKYTQEQLAEKLYLTAESVSNFENGKTMCMPENVARICELFDVTADYIYYGVECNGVVTGANNIVNLVKDCNPNELDRIGKMIMLFLG